jgi:lipopolysaccharide transport system ATP-binding protein
LSTGALLTVSGLSKCYERYERPWQRLLGHFIPYYRRKAQPFWAVRDVSFALYPGQTLGIIGRNGSGKSTLLQIISGTLTPTQGSVSSGGRIAALLELGAGFNPEFTGRENVFLNGAIYGLSRSEVQARLDAILAFADIGDFIDEPVQHYSSGMFVRLAFSVIAHVDADILIIDEALAVGDALFANKCMRFLEGFRQRGAILFVSHDTGTVTRLCDEVLWLNRGEAMQLGPARAVSEAYLEYLYAEQQRVAPDDAVDETQLARTTALAEALRAEAPVDARHELLAASNLRNAIDLEPFAFDGSAFGTGKASLLDVCFRDLEGRRLAHVTGGDTVILDLRFLTHDAIDALIAGFLFKDRQGQVLFGENTLLFYRDQPVRSVPDQVYLASFRFTLPYLPAGEYLISVAIASGTQDDHLMHCWRHDALLFSVLSSHVVHGIIGLPVAACTLVPSSRPGPPSEDVGEA